MDNRNSRKLMNRNNSANKSKHDTKNTESSYDTKRLKGFLAGAAIAALSGGWLANGIASAIIDHDTPLYDQYSCSNDITVSVKPGDNLWNLTKESMDKNFDNNDVRDYIDVVQEHNNLDNTGLKVGQTLKIPRNCK